MSGEQYGAILSALADALNEKDNTILLQKWRIEELEKALAEAEAHLPPNGEKPKTLEIR